MALDWACRRPQRERKACSSPDSTPCSPVDSGYGSQPSSPPQNKQASASPSQPTQEALFQRLTAQTPYHFDGSIEEHDADLDLLLGLHSTYQSRKPATLPRAARRHRPPLPPAFHSYTIAGLDSATNFKSRRRASGGSLRMPDRFVPQRNQSTHAGEVFRTNKTSHELSNLEMIMRHGDATPDAFAYSRRTVTPTAAEIRQVSRSDSAVIRHAPFITTTGTVLGTLPRRNLGHTERQVSSPPLGPMLAHQYLKC
jgi:hypothetical protein